MRKRGDYTVSTVKAHTANGAHDPTENKRLAAVCVEQRTGHDHTDARRAHQRINRPRSP